MMTVTPEIPSRHRRPRFAKRKTKQLPGQLHEEQDNETRVGEYPHDGKEGDRTVCKEVALKTGTDTTILLSLIGNYNVYIVLGRDG